jgi:acetoin utilization protein AcuC
MQDRAIFYYGPAFQKYRFHDEHPFNPLRLQLTWDLLQELHALRPEQVREPVAASRDELELAHDRRYIEAVMAASSLLTVAPEELAELGLHTEDTPVFPGMHEAASIIAGTTLDACRTVYEGRAVHAMNMAGGLHHAHRGQASGFCVYNDIGVAIAYLRKTYNARVAYIDTDAHHGDGVEQLFYEDPNVLTISLHETGRYLFPGTGGVEERGDGPGYGYAVNIPLEAFTEDGSYIEILQNCVPPLIASFQPDIIISQNGCDSHRYDPLTHLAATTRLFAEIPRLVHRLAHEHCQGKWVAVGGGGYDIWRVVPRAWAMLWAEMADLALPDQIPASWIAKWQPIAPVPLPDRFIDPADLFPAMPRRAEIEEKNAATARRALGGVPFLYG